MNDFYSKVWDMQQYKIDNLINMKPTINRLAEDLNNKFSLSEEKYFDIRLVLSELVMNAFQHGKSELMVDVFLDSNYSRDEIKITVEDYGAGFNPANVSSTFEERDVYENSGRGIKIVNALCEQVMYNEIGNSVSIVMRI